jgi:phospholipase C
VFDHTSTLRFLETRFRVRVPNLSAWRRRATGDLTAAFNFAARPRYRRPRLPRPDGGAPAHCTTFMAVPVPSEPFPRQEHGKRRHPSGIVRHRG